ncbi:metalloregulator ArsR/SmtB family transcription factor [Exiguobacterium acetylicum]|uniref:ArsR/SmtB family transcription factor n=1 Tax=Exiguobacterium TaxID=33986 RepID=UPI00045111D7|nr:MULTISPECIES: metalloregulator ArsR/SmtB family transcription factor [Exiguobacterium]EZP61284.1 ArsR family transcriptional regulator [Exiguobacterium sp. RIT341]KQS45311.1 ArsR family transcriptional regulator [Exiguobacterium sp. Leaf196]MDQ6466677.1 metalloregulator ArsR/SmtB family transcription factor [Exiguobacterium acetylicum]
MTRFDPEIETMSQYLKGLSDPVRLDILRRLQVREHCVCDLTAAFDISQPAISRHLKRLREQAIISERRDRQWIYYRLNREHPYYGQLEWMLRRLDTADVRSSSCTVLEI